MEAPGSLRSAAASILVGVSRTLLPRVEGLEAGEQARVERELGEFLSFQFFAMPRYLSVPCLSALFVFDWLPILRHGRRFGRLDFDTQSRIVSGWKESRIGGKRSFVKLVLSCALFYFLGHPLVMRRLEAGATLGVPGVV